jgi:hypothetical protein
MIAWKDEKPVVMVLDLTFSEECWKLWVTRKGIRK